jgi:RNA polymerase sigma factor (sigma-70 family)
MPIILDMAGISAPLPRARTPAFALRAMGDDRLFRLAAAGDQRAFEVIYERHYQALYRYCRSIVGNAEDAADALQSTMVSALRGLAGERRQIAVRPWLFRIAHNESITVLRKRQSHAALDDAFDLEAPAHDPNVRQRLDQLVADLQQLPDGQRGALVMHELSGLRYKAIGEALGTSEQHAKQLVYEARTALHDMEKGRGMECEEIRRAISENDGRVMRGRRIRAHLRACSDCSGFAELIGTRQRDLAAIAPPLPAALAAGLLHNLLGGGASSGGAVAAASSGGGGLGGLAAGKTLAAPMLGKAAAVLAIAVAGVGTIEITDHAGRKGTKAASPATHSSAAHAPKAASPQPVSPSAGTASPLSHRPAPAAERNKQGAGHGHSKTAPGHAHSGPQAQQVHPSHPAHPTHPVHPAHPTHPSHPTHPAHPDHPAPGQGGQKHATTAPGGSNAKPSPSEPQLPLPAKTAPESAVPPVTLTPPGQGNGKHP